MFRAALPVALLAAAAAAVVSSSLMAASDDEALLTGDDECLSGTCGVSALQLRARAAAPSAAELEGRGDRTEDVADDARDGKPSAAAASSTTMPASSHGNASQHHYHGAGGNETGMNSEGRRRRRSYRRRRQVNHKFQRPGQWGFQPTRVEPNHQQARYCEGRELRKGREDCCGNRSYDMMTYACCGQVIYDHRQLSCCNHRNGYATLYHAYSENCCDDPSVKNKRGGICEVQEGDRSCCNRAVDTHRRRRRWPSTTVLAEEEAMLNEDGEVLVYNSTRFVEEEEPAAEGDEEDKDKGKDEDEGEDESDEEHDAEDEKEESEGDADDEEDAEIE